MKEGGGGRGRRERPILTATPDGFTMGLLFRDGHNHSGKFNFISISKQFHKKFNI